jgi:hypothetical protein
MKRIKAYLLIILRTTKATIVNAASSAFHPICSRHHWLALHAAPLFISVSICNLLSFSATDEPHQVWLAGQLPQMASSIQGVPISPGMDFFLTHVAFDNIIRNH